MKTNEFLKKLEQVKSLEEFRQLMNQARQAGLRPWTDATLSEKVATKREELTKKAEYVPSGIRSE